MSRFDLASRPDESGEIDAAARWELIERILNSREFRRALRLRELLQYIGKRSIHNGATTISEQEIGEAVFGRADDYDTSLDNIVRVNVTELRKRLSLYFEGEGAGETLLVEIPRGSYVPVFHYRPSVAEAPPAEALVAPETAVPVGIPEPETGHAGPRQPYRVAFFLALAVALTACCAAMVISWRNAVLESQIRPWHSDTVQRDFWSEFFASPDEVDLVTADSSLALTSDFLRRRVSLNDYLNYKYKNIADAPGLTADSRDLLALVLNRNLGSVGDFRVATGIMALYGRGSHLKLASARAFTPENAKNNNVILIGGPESNPWYDIYKDRMDFYVAYDSVSRHPSLINRAPASGESPVYDIYEDPNLGYSIVTFMPNLNPHRSALVIAGTDSQATLAAGEWVTSSEGLRWIRQKAPSGLFPYFEVLLSNSKIESTPLRTEVKAFRVHPR
jgi:hypothetical protein